MSGNKSNSELRNKQYGILENKQNKNQSNKHEKTLWCWRLQRRGQEWLRCSQRSGCALVSAVLNPGQDL